MVLGFFIFYFYANDFDMTEKLKSEESGCSQRTKS